MSLVKVTELIDILNIELQCQSISERGLQIGTTCEVYSWDVKWWEGQVNRIYVKTNTNQVWVNIVNSAEKLSTDYHEWNRYIIVKHNKEEAAENDIDYAEVIYGCSGIVHECIPTRRIINGLKYYQTLGSDDGDKEKFIKFINNQYPQLLNDWTHFISKHNDLYQL